MCGYELKDNRIRDDLLPLCPLCGERLYCFKNNEELTVNYPVYHISCVYANVYQDRPGSCKFSISSFVNYANAFYMLHLLTGCEIYDNKKIQMTIFNTEEIL